MTTVNLIDQYVLKTLWTATVIMLGVMGIGVICFLT